MEITKATLQNLNCAKYLKTCVCVCVYMHERSRFSDIERSRDAETGNWKHWIFFFTTQAKLFTKNIFVDDFGNHNTSKYYRILQEKSLQKAYCFIFINNTQNKQRIPYKQPQ